MRTQTWRPFVIGAIGYLTVIAVQNAMDRLTGPPPDLYCDAANFRERGIVFDGRAKPGAIITMTVASAAGEQTLRYRVVNGCSLRGERL